MGFTGSLILAHTPVPLTDLEPLTGHDAELVGRREDQWQLVAVDGHAPDTPGWAAALVEATAAPVLIAVVDDSDTALLLADSPGRSPVGSRCSTPQRAARAGRRSPTPGR